MTIRCADSREANAEEDASFHFPHYLFPLLFLLFYIPTDIIFNYFVEDWMYGGRYFVASSMTAIILYMALCNLQYYWFCRRLRDYLLPEHEALYLRLTAQKVGELSIFPIVLCRWTLKWGETDPALDAVRRSVLQFGNSARLILAIMLPIPYVMSALGYTHILKQIVT